MNVPFVPDQVVVCVAKEWQWGSTGMISREPDDPVYGERCVVKRCFHSFLAPENDWAVSLKTHPGCSYDANGFRPLDGIPDFFADVKEKERSPEEEAAV